MTVVRPIPFASPRLHRYNNKKVVSTLYTSSWLMKINNSITQNVEYYWARRPFIIVAHCWLRGHYMGPKRDNFYYNAFFRINDVQQCVYINNNSIQYANDRQKLVSFLYVARVDSESLFRY